MLRSLDLLVLVARERRTPAHVVELSLALDLLSLRRTSLLGHELVEDLSSRTWAC